MNTGEWISDFSTFEMKDKVQFYFSFPASFHLFLESKEERGVKKLKAQNRKAKKVKKNKKMNSKNRVKAFKAFLQLFKLMLLEPLK